MAVARRIGQAGIICSMSWSHVVLTFFLFVSVGMDSQQDKTKTKGPELAPRRGECAIFLPERDERHDLARLVRAEQFLDCERDGFPEHLAPPWKDSEEGTKKLSAACEYFVAKSVREYPQAGQASLQLAADRCRINVFQVMLEQLVQSAGGSKK
jgi:hypothetical protein